jgi:ribonuclease R
VVHPGGFGFAERLDEGEGSIFVPPGNFGGAMDGDEVVVSWWPAQRGAEGHVRSVVARGRTRVTGVLRRLGRHVRLELDDPRLLGATVEVVGAIPKDAEGRLVVGTIVDYPEPWEPAFTARLERILGEPGSLDAELAKILVEHGVDSEFPEAVVQESASVPDRVTAPDREGREDLRAYAFMTIDPKDARDFDDAVCVELHGKDLRRATMTVHVAVADVSHYVREGTAIDAEAVRRSFSTYLPDRAIPMLPEVLSSGICSLVPRKDRCAVVVTFELDAQGRAGEARVRVAVIHSQARLTYEQVAAELAGAQRLPEEVRERLVILRAASDRLRAHRLRRGAVELNLPETKIRLDEDDRSRIRAIVSARGDPQVARAYNLIEELMLAANEGVARVAAKAKVPVPYRVHDRPEEERVEKFCTAAAALGVEIDPEELEEPRGVRALLARLSDHPRAAVLHGLLLRAMAQAEYATVNLGHFALASTAYLHFTSPIRRYPDLVAHRAMKALLAHRGHPVPHPAPAMPRLKDVQAEAVRASARERACAGAENDAKDLFAAMFMRDRLGDKFPGTVTGLVASGAFVTLDDPFVQGMIRRLQLERDARDAWELDESGVRWVAPRSGRSLTLGDRVVVEVLDASTSRRQVDLRLVEIVGVGEIGGGEPTGEEPGAPRQRRGRTEDRGRPKGRGRR